MHRGGGCSSNGGHKEWVHLLGGICVLHALHHAPTGYPGPFFDLLDHLVGLLVSLLVHHLWVHSRSHLCVAHPPSCPRQALAPSGLPEGSTGIESWVRATVPQFWPTHCQVLRYKHKYTNTQNKNTNTKTGMKIWIRATVPQWWLTHCQVQLHMFDVFSQGLHNYDQSLHPMFNISLATLLPR